MEIDDFPESQMVNLTIEFYNFVVLQQLGLSAESNHYWWRDYRSPFFLSRDFDEIANTCGF